MHATLPDQTQRDATGSIGARMPHLLTIGIVGAGTGLVLMTISGTAVYLAARPRRS